MMRNTKENRNKLFLSVQVLLVGTIISLFSCLILDDSVIPPILAGLLVALTIGLALEYIHMEKYK